MAIIQKGYHSNEDYIDFINYVFGMNGSPSSSFSTLLPKLYRDGRETDKDTYFALDNDRIVGAVLSYPLTFRADGKILTARGIGSVSTHPRHRGEGFMKDLMKTAIDDMVKDDIDFSVLGGRRHRYAHFGFEKCDGMMYFSITPKTVSYVNPDRRGITMREVKADDTALLDTLFEKMHQRPYYTERPREDLHDILCSWRARPYAFFQSETLVGWAVHYVSKRQFSEFCPLDPALTQAMLAVAIDSLGQLSIAIPAYDYVLGAEVDVLAEDVNIISNECFLVLNWQRVLSTLLAFLNDKRPLIDGALTVKIEGMKETVNLTLSVKDGKTSVDLTDKAPEITLTQTQAEALFFRNYSVLRAKINPPAASWLPLPLFIFEPDNV